MKRIVFAATMSTAIFASSHAFATELWDDHIRGLDVGLAYGALPPPGVYFINNSMGAVFRDYNSNANSVPKTNLDAMVDVPILLWSTGLKILGGQYALGISQPFDYTNIGPGYGLPTGSGNLGFYNTIIAPAQLSWEFGHFFVKTGVQIYLNDASTTPATVVEGKSVNGGLPTGNGYTTVSPTFAVSWLKDGWNLTISSYLDLPVGADTATNGSFRYSYRSGDMFLVDYTAVKTIGKWTFGLGGASQNQLNADTVSAGVRNHGEVTNYSLGPLAGYDFGRFSLTAIWMHGVYTKNDVGGDLVNIRLVTRF